HSGAAAPGRESDRFVRPDRMAFVFVSIQPGGQLSPGVRCAIPERVGLVLGLAPDDSSAGLVVSGAGRTLAAPSFARGIDGVCAPQPSPPERSTIRRRSAATTRATRFAVAKSNRVACEPQFMEAVVCL